MVASRTIAVAVAVAVPAIASAQPRVHTDTREIRACLPFDGGAIAGTGGGLIVVDAGGRRRATFTALDGLPGTRIDSLARIGDDLWIGSDAGAARVRIAGDRIAVERTVASRPASDIERWNGSIYIATLDGGVLRVTATGAVKIAMRGGATGARARVLSLAAAADGLYAGTAAGLYRLAGARFDPVDLGATPVIADLLADGARLWIATPDGVLVRDGTTVTPIANRLDVRRLAMIDGVVHAASVGGGIVRVDRGRLVAADRPRDLAMAHAVAARDGATCAGGSDGLWIGRGDTWTHAPLRSPLPSNDVSAIAVDGDRIVAGTYDRGLVTWRRGDGWSTAIGRDVDGRINAIAIARGRIVVGTAVGLAIVDGTVVRKLGRRDGLPGRSVLAVAVLADGRIIAGTSSGAVVIDGDDVTRVGPRDAGNVWAVAVDRSGRLWLGTTTGVHRGPIPRDATKDEDVAGWHRFSRATGELRDDWVMALAVRGDQVWAGSYKGGIVRFDGGDRATHVGDGWVNPGGLTVDGDRILASTQDGLHAIAVTGDRAAPIAGRLPGRDVTATARLGDTLWVATRRGIAELD